MTRLLVCLLCAVVVACSEGDAKQKKEENAKAAPPALPVSVIEVAPRACASSISKGARSIWKSTAPAFTESPSV